MKIILMLSFLMTLSACSSISSQKSKVELGQSKMQVQENIGPAQYKQVEGAREAWQYCTTGISDSYLIVWFNNGRVINTSSYNRRDGVGACSEFFKPVDLEL